MTPTYAYAAQPTQSGSPQSEGNMNSLPAAVAPPLVPDTATQSAILRHWPPRSPMPQMRRARSNIEAHA